MLSVWGKCFSGLTKYLEKPYRYLCDLTVKRGGKWKDLHGFAQYGREIFFPRYVISSSEMVKYFQDKAGEKHPGTAVNTLLLQQLENLMPGFTSRFPVVSKGSSVLWGPMETMLYNLPILLFCHPFNRAISATWICFGSYFTSCGDGFADNW